MEDALPSRICDGTAGVAFRTTVLRRHRVRYFSCTSCGCLQSERPYWLEEAYGDPIEASDTGIMARNLRFSRAAAVVFFSLFDRAARFVDYGGGYGVFVRLMRDYGFEFLWQDRYAPNLFARGYEYRDQMPVEAVTAFEVLEHLPDAGAELRDIFAISRNLFCSTVLLPGLRNFVTCFTQLIHLAHLTPVAPLNPETRHVKPSLMPDPSGGIAPVA